MQWGIIGAGDIARKFTDNARRTGSQVVAVGSRSGERARAWADEQSVPNAHGSYEALVQDADVECVYVATNHVDHVANALLAVGAGRHVLVEKPLGITAAQAQQLFDAARRAGVVAMEGMWTAFLPAWEEILARLDDGAIGQLHSATIRLGRAIDASLRERTRLFDPHRAGGALLDMGIYTASIAYLVAGAADDVEAEATLRDGVDAHAVVTATHGDVRIRLETAIDRDLDSTADLAGSEGSIHVPDACHHPHGFRLTTQRGEEWVDAPYGGGGFEGEIAAFEDAVAQGRSEVPGWPHAATLATHGVLDEVRRQVGLRFPFEPALP